jgi:hypothetical protein
MKPIKLKELLESYGNPDTPKTNSMTGDGWSGDAECVGGEDCRELERAFNSVLKAAKFTVLTGEGLTELSQAIDNYDKFKK